MGGNAMTWDRIRMENALAETPYDPAEMVAAQVDDGEPERMAQTTAPRVENAELAVADRPDFLRWRPFPVDQLPKVLRSFALRGADALGCDPAFLAVSLLATAAG